MKLIILTSNKNTYAVSRLQDEAKKRNITVETYNYKDLSCSFGKWSIFFSSGKKKISFTGACVRAWRPQLYNIRDMRIYNLLLTFFYQNDIPFINKKFLERHIGISHKALQYLILSSYTKHLILPTFYFESKEELKSNLRNISYPIIVKPADGSLGSGVKKIAKKKQLVEMFKYLEPSNFVFQKYISNTGDIRVIYLWWIYVGAMMRQGKNWNIVNNFSKWGNVTAYNLSDPIKKELTALVKKINIDYVGIDIIIKGSSYHILEINQNPWFKWFEQCTWINIAERIVDFLAKKKTQ